MLDTHAPFEAVGGFYREEAIMMLRRFYMSENQNAPNPKKKASRVLKTEIAPMPSSATASSATTPASSRSTSVAPGDKLLPLPMPIGGTLVSTPRGMTPAPGGQQ
jgi:tRNA-specific adenosine deaminase 2